ncbi:MAG: roadblock/LC7 domain-containing protein [Acidobacteriota bacterium]|jgi:predicted regulator of Ras-like GTPase activity (Roadblock/LC7/MglB family)
MTVNLNTLNLHETEFNRIKVILDTVREDLHADIVLLVNQGGQSIVISESNEKFDYTSLASLAAANLAATNGLANLVGEGEFSVLVHQGRNRSLYISDLLRKFSLVLVFNASTTLGLVRYKVKKTVILLEEVIQDILNNSPKNIEAEGNPDFSEEELEKLLEL